MSPATQTEQQAAEWLIRVDSAEMTAQERLTFQTWLEADARNRVAYLRLQVAWKKSGKLLKLQGWPDLEKPLSRARLAIAAGLLAAIGVTWFVAFPPGWQTHVTAIGNSERIALPDGSTAILNTDSRIRVHFTGERRDIELTRGEAHFQVARDSRRPFQVLARDTVVRAVGTAFSVRLREDERQVDVLVTEGRVALSADSELAAGDAAIIRAEGLRVRKMAPADVYRKLAWQDGLLRFNGETLVEAVAEFNRYNTRQLTIADPRIAGLRVGGGFQTTDVDSFLAALERSFGIRALRPERSRPSGRPIQLVAADAPLQAK